MKAEILSCPNGLTVKELKEAIKDWPEIDPYGEPTEVWVETGLNLSGQVKAVWPLNKREMSADIIFMSGAWEKL